jgi:hypothetical protein
MAKKKGARRLSGNPAKAAAERQLRSALAADAAHTAALMAQMRGAPNPTDADWHRLEEELRKTYPRCPDCGAPMDGDADSGEEGADDEGNTVISMSLVCIAWDAADEAGEEPPPHPTTGGVVLGELTLRAPSRA